MRILCTTQRPGYVRGRVSPAPAQDEDSGVRQDLDALNGKVDRLQQDVERAIGPKIRPRRRWCLRRHVEEVRNYAISNGTLWVLNAPAAKEIR